VPPTSSGVGFYDDPLIYDVLHAPDARGDVQLLRRLARRLGTRPGKEPPLWLEPACGPARQLMLAARHGVDVLGVDLSKPMIAHARAAFGRDRANRPPGVRGRFLRADMTDLRGRVRTRSVDLAFCLINSIRHLESEGAMLAHLREIGRVLRPGGIYLVGLSVSMYGLETTSEDVWEGRDARSGITVKQIVTFEPPTRRGDRFEQVHSHLVITRRRGVKRGGAGGRKGTDKTSEEHRDSRYRLFCWSRAQWEGVVARAGMEIAGFFDLDGNPIPPRELGYGVYALRVAVHAPTDGNFPPA